MNLRIKNRLENQKQKTLKEQGNSGPDSLKNIWKVFLHTILISIMPGSRGFLEISSDYFFVFIKVFYNILGCSLPDKSSSLLNSSLLNAL